MVRDLAPMAGRAILTYTISTMIVFGLASVFNFKIYPVLVLIALMGVTIYELAKKGGPETGESVWRVELYIVLAYVFSMSLTQMRKDRARALLNQSQT